MSASNVSIISTRCPDWADMEADNMDVETVESDIQEGHQPICTPHFYVDPQRRMFKMGDTMLFIRAPPKYDAWKVYLLQPGHAVPGLDKPESLKQLGDQAEFDKRMKELEERIEQKKADPAREATITTVKRRKGPDGQVHANNPDAENIEPKSKSKSGAAKRTEPSVKEKIKQANDFLDYWSLPANPKVQRCALSVVVQKFRGGLRSRMSNSKKPRNLSKLQFAVQRLRDATEDIAKFLHQHYNNPFSEPSALEQLIAGKGPDCIEWIRKWLDNTEVNTELSQVNDDVMNEMVDIFSHFQRTIENLGQSVERETRHYMIKSLHKLACTKVRINRQSCLCGCFSGKANIVQDHFQTKGDYEMADQVKNKPGLCKDLRNEKGIYILAFLNENGDFIAMPGPFDAFPEGYIFIGCEICQGSTRTDCNCKDWLDSLSITGCEPFMFELDEMIVPSHLDLYCFGGKRWGESQGILNLRQFTADENGNFGVQLVGLSKED